MKSQAVRLNTAQKIAEAKAALRRKILDKRRDFAIYPPLWRQTAEATLTKRLMRTRRWRQAKTVMAYASMPDEVQLYDFLRLGEGQGKKILLPSHGANDRQSKMEAVELAKYTSLTPEELGQWYKAGNNFFPPEDIDLIIVPGVAFTKDGLRLGMGGGYYDRFLPRAVNAYKVALAYEFQIVPDLPVTSMDVKVDLVIA